jgi:hydroxyacylglutathione hydrolase
MAKMMFRKIELMPFGTNCYIVASEQTKDGMVIDPAWDAPKIISNIQELGLNIGLVVLTHIHADHVAAASEVIESTGASFAVHAAEAPSLKNYDFSRIAAFAPNFTPPPEPDRTLNDGDILAIGDLEFKVLHTPGHSPGGISILGYGVVFSGDALFNTSIGRTDLPEGDHGLLISSIRSKLLSLPDETVVLPGHGPKTTIGNERRFNPFLR